MKKQLIVILILFFSAKCAISQEYIRSSFDPLSDSINYFGLEYFCDSKTRLYGYKKGVEIAVPAKYNYTQGFSKKGIARVTMESPDIEDEYASWKVGGYYTHGMIFDNGGLNGFIDTLDNVVISIKYRALGALEIFDVVPYSIYIYDSGKRIEKYGLINDKGDIIVEPIYDFIYQHGKRVFEARMLIDNKIEDCFYIDETGLRLEDGGRFDKFRVVSEGAIMMFYAEYDDTAYLLDCDLKPYKSTYIRQFKDSKRVMEVLQESLISNYNRLIDDLQKFSPKITEETLDK